MSTPATNCRHGAAPISMDNLADRAAISKILELVVLAQPEDERKKCEMLSATVVTKHLPRRPGRGFYSLAERLYLLSPGANAQQREQMWWAEVAKLENF